MNLVEAVKSGKDFRRPNECGWFSYSDGGTKNYLLSHDDILADDWIVVESTVTITRTHFNEAWLACNTEHGGNFTNSELAKKLGLE